MKREAYRHPKMLDLAARLDVSRATAIGIVQLLLDYCADVAPQGNIGKWPDGAIARACEWPNDPDAFVSALVSAGWLDECPEHRLVIHDLEDHAEQWWHLKLKKLGLAFLKATAEATAVGTAMGTAEGSADATAERSILPSSALPFSALPSPSGAATAAPPLPQPLLAGLDSALEQAPASPADPKKPSDPPRKPEKFDPETLILPPELGTPAFVATWREWLAFRRKRRHSTDEGCLKRQLRDLAPLGAKTAVECLELALRNGYQGLPIDRFTHGTRSSQRTRVGPGQRFSG